MKKTKRRVFKEIEISLIDRPRSTARIGMDPTGIEELARNIEKRGLIHPILLVGRNERFEIVAGDRRFLAFQWLKRKVILAEVQDLTEKEVKLQRGTENLHRKNLSPVEEAKVYADLIENAGMSIEDIGKETGRSSAVIKRRMDVLRMPESFQKALHSRAIALSTAEEIWGCPDQTYRDYLIDMAVEHGATKEVARMWVQDWKKAHRGGDKSSAGGGLERGAMEPDPIYRACDLCKDPVEYSKVKELRMCPVCFEEIAKIVRGGK